MLRFVFVQKNNIDEAIRVFSKTVDLNVLSNTQHQSTQFNLASLYGSKEEWDLTIDALMKFYEFERDPVAEAYIMTGIAYFQKGLPLSRSSTRSSACRLSTRRRWRWPRTEE